MNKIGNDTFEMNLQEFRIFFPDLANSLPFELFNDGHYIVRIDTVSHRVEIGYRSDDWFIR